MAQQLSSLVQNTLAVDVTNITGTIPVLKGGTGATTAAAALTNLGAYAASNPSGYTTNTGTVTSVAALTLGTTGTDFTSTVATGTTTPAITLNVPTASASNRGALSAADWTTFNSKLGSYTEADTLATVTARGATTTVVPTFSNGATIQGLTVGVGAGAVATNTAVGVSVLQANTTGSGNTAIGYQALYSNTGGIGNIASGRQALYSTTTGNNNTASGYQTLYSNLTGSNNIAIGVSALYSNTAWNNIAIGTGAGTNLTTGANNVIIGSIAGTAGLVSTIIIGAGSTERLRVDSAGKMITLGQVETPDVTSLLTTANTYPTTRPSLNLDFANSATLDPRITFTRGTNATYTGSDGLVKTTAGINSPRFDWDPVTRECKGLLIEEVRTNLLTYSSNFDNAVWGTYAPMLAAIPSIVITPNGTYSAYTFNTNNGGSFYQDVSGINGTGTYTGSIYISKLSACTNLTVIGYFLSATIESFGGVTLNPQTAVNTTTSSYTITDLGNNWLRVTFTKTGTYAGNTAIRFQIYNNTGSVASITVWGAQLEAGAFATSYIPSSVTWTGRASTATYVGSNGLIQTAASGVARYQYNPTNLSVAPFLLLEPAATNLLTYSEQFDNANWAKARGTVTANALVAPNGTTSGDTFAGNGESGGTQSVFQAVTASASTAYVISVFAKAGTTNWITLQGFDGTTVPRAWFNISAGTVGTVESGMSNGQIVSMGNGWFRCSVVRTTGASATSLRSQFGLAASDGNEATESFLTMSLWGIQVETGSVATSYIPTVASQVTRIADTSTSAQTTRSADVATMTNSNFSSWYNQTEGTMIINVAVPYPAAYSGYTYMLGSFNDGIYHYRQSDSQSVVRIRVGSTDQFGALGWGATWATTAINKNALTYKLNDFNAANNGGAPGSSDTSGIVPTVNALTIGSNNGSSYINGTIAKLTYYPTRLSNSTLQALTT